MEGTSGKISNFALNIVKKTIKQQHKAMTASDQFELQKKAIQICKNNNFKIIKIPNVYECEKNSYTMDKIDDSTPYYQNESNNNTEFIKELDIYYSEFIKIGYIPNDIECYLQDNNTIFIIDFDKYIKINSQNKKYMAHFVPEQIRLKYLEDPMVQ